jgi:hypothetical protein
MSAAFTEVVAKLIAAAATPQILLLMHTLHSPTQPSGIRRAHTPFAFFFLPRNLPGKKVLRRIQGGESAAFELTTILPGFAVKRW